jgi:metal-dependent amidase/aminoacylase/carboxypeptidase family protein
LGEGGHASMSHQGKDVIVIAAELISAIQSIVSRNTDPWKHQSLRLEQAQEDIDTM